VPSDAERGAAVACEKDVLPERGPEERRWRFEPPPRVTREQRLEANLSALGARRGRLDALSDGERALRRSQQAVAGVLVASLLFLGAASLWARHVEDGYAAKAADLQSRIDRLRAAAPSYGQPSGGPTADPAAAAAAAAKALADARTAADGAATSQNALGATTAALRARNGSVEDEAGVDGSEELNVFHRELGARFSARALTWSDADMYSGASMWGVASRDGQDPRLVWAPAGGRAVDDGGCTWTTAAVTAPDLLSTKDAAQGGGTAVLWTCTGTAGELGWARALYDGTALSSFSAGALGGQ